jgi:5-methylcytosine-specific restriction endonuclease McrA
LENHGIPGSVRRCRGCARDLPLTEYHVSRRDGPAARCRDCLNAKTRAYHGANREKLNRDRVERARRNHAREHARKLAWQRANPERKAQASKRSALRNPDRYRARVANQNHKRRSVTGDGVTTTQWYAIRADYGKRCAYCGRAPRTLTQDHVDPLSLGGAHSPENVVPACARCNGSKSNRKLLLWVAGYGMPA